MMRFSLSMIVATTVSLFSALSESALSAQEAKPERPWTLMIYGAADNSADGPMLEFLDSIRIALDDDPGMEIVLWIDRSTKYSTDDKILGADFTGARVYRIRKNSAELLDASKYFPGMTPGKDYEADSADPRNIGRFVAFCKDRFPARRYGLMIYSHANGKDMCPDHESGRSMYIPELSDVVGEEASVDFLALELCAMGGIEIAYQWRPGNGGFSAKVLLAIPTSGPPLDWDRAFARIRSPGHASAAKGIIYDPQTMTETEFGRLVIEEGFAGRNALLERMTAQYPEKMKQEIASGGEQLREAAGCFDLQLVEKAKKAIDRFAVELANSDSKAAFEDVRGPGDDVQIMNYTRRGKYQSRPYADLYELLDRAAMSKELSKKVREASVEAREAVDQMVLASFGMKEGFKGFKPGRNGIYIVFPDGDSPVTNDAGAPSVWSKFGWYSPLSRAGTKGPYGNWSFLRDGAQAANGKVENWFELLDYWYDEPKDDALGWNRYAW